LNATTVTVISSPNPSDHGATVTILAAVNGSVTTATGKITFHAGGNVLGDATLDATGAAAFATAALPVGAQTLGAEYAGDAANSPASGTVTHVVNAPATAKRADAGPPDAAVEPPRHDATIAEGARAPSAAPPQEAAYLGGANNCGCRFVERRRTQFPGLIAVALTLGLVSLRRIRWKSAMTSRRRSISMGSLVRFDG
jgi:hypothetical protein